MMTRRSAILGSLSVGAMLGGVLPALWAAMLEPVEALRHE